MALSPFNVCAIPSCTYESLNIVCYCCHLNICTKHLYEHLTMLVNKITLKQWSTEFAQIFGALDNESYQNFFNSQLEELNHLHVNIEQILRLQDMTNSISAIELTDCSYAVLAGNQQHLLVHREPNLCLLDHQLTIIQETPWSLDDISDICWSSTLNRFILVNCKHILTLDDKTMILEPYLSSNTINWMRGTCSDNRLYLSTEGTGSSIFEYALMMPSTTLIKEWQTPLTCTNDEWIEDFKFHNGFFGLVISRCTNNEACFELRSSTTMQCIWSLQLDQVCSMYGIRCCPITSQQWMVVSFRNPRIFHISMDGKIVNINKRCRSPSNLCQVQSNLMAIWDQKCIYLKNLF